MITLIHFSTEGNQRSIEKVLYHQNGLVVVIINLHQDAAQRQFFSEKICPNCSLALQYDLAFNVPNSVW